MALRIVLVLENVTGESQLKGVDDGKAIEFEKEGGIDIDTYNLDFHQSGTFHRGKGSSGGGVSVGDLMMTKKLDKSSADLMRKVCLGTTYPTAKLYVMKTTGEGDTLGVYYKIEMTDVIVSSYNVGGSGDGLDYITESFSLNFREFSAEYSLQEKDGILAVATTVGYNIAENVEV